MWNLYNYPSMCQRKCHHVLYKEVKMTNHCGNHTFERTHPELCPFPGREVMWFLFFEIQSKALFLLCITFCAASYLHHGLSSLRVALIPISVCRPSLCSEVSVWSAAAPDPPPGWPQALSTFCVHQTRKSIFPAQSPPPGPRSLCEGCLPY